MDEKKAIADARADAVAEAAKVVARKKNEVAHKEELNKVQGKVDALQTRKLELDAKSKAQGKVHLQFGPSIEPHGCKCFTLLCWCGGRSARRSRRP